MFLNDAFASCDAISMTYNITNKHVPWLRRDMLAFSICQQWLWLLLDQEINTTACMARIQTQFPCCPGQVKTTTTTRFVYDSIALRQLGDQEAPIDLLVKSIVKEYFFICDPNQVSASVDAAYTLATEGAKGQCGCIPIDIHKDLDLRPDTELRKHSVAPYVARHQHEHPEIDRAVI